MGYAQIEYCISRVGPIMSANKNCRSKSCEFSPAFNGNLNLYTTEILPCNQVCKNISLIGSVAKPAFWVSFIIGAYMGLLSYITDTLNYGYFSIALLFLAFVCFVAIVFSTLWPSLQQNVKLNKNKELFRELESKF